MGLTVVITDRDPTAASVAEADHFEQADATDADAILRIARHYAVDAVIAEQTDVAVHSAAVVSEALGLPGIDVKTAARATNKRLMRDACRDAGIPVPRYHYVEAVADARRAAKSIGAPVVVKPVDNQSSRGVTKVRDGDRLDAAFDRAKRASRSGGVLVEEMMEGTEGSIESFVDGETVHVMGFCDKVKCAPPFSYDLQLIYPGNYDEPMARDIRALNAEVIKAVGIRSGLTHAEFMVTRQGVRLIEIAARGCGARVVTDLMSTMLGVDVVACRLRQAIGKPIQWSPNPSFRYGILRFLECPPGRVTHISGLSDAASLQNVVMIDLSVAVGDVIGAVESGDQRPGFLQAVGDSRSEVIALADRAGRTLDIGIAAE
jgi:biotin carboxylase